MMAESICRDTLLRVRTKRTPYRVSLRNSPLYIVGIFIVCLLSFVPVLAQERAVTDDEVNAVAGKLYCPVCENIPLDTCGTPACTQWKAEIRQQLEAGQTPEQVIAEFVARFGQRVVGTPQDPTLRALSLITPYVLALIALVVGVATFLRWQGGRAGDTLVASVNGASPTTDDEYRAQLERDLLERR